MLWPGFDFDTTEPAHRQGAYPADNKVRDVVVEVTDCPGDEVAALEDADLVGDVRPLTLKAPADDALYNLACLVVFVFLFEQQFRLCSMLIELLVGHEPPIPV